VSRGAHLTERMVDVAHGRCTWTDLEAAHLAGCPECAAEWRLTVCAADAGIGVQVDTERMAEAVLARLAAQPARRRSFGWVVGLAAAAAIVIFSLQARLGQPTAPAAAVPAATVLSELDDLTHDELLTVLDALDPLPDDAAVPVATPLGDLTPGELERVLRSLEG
jgi:hypothetical protein